MELRHDDRRASRHPEPGAAEEERPGPAQREVLGSAGGATARRMAEDHTSGAGAAMPSLEDSQQLLQKSVFSVGAGATATEGGEVYQEGNVRVRINPGTRFNVRLDPGGLHLSANPGIEVDVTGPNLRVSSMSYSFGEARFRAEATASFDVFGMYAHFAAGALERALDQKVKTRLPAALQKPGYSPSHDPDLQGTISQLQGALGGLVDSGGHDGARGGAHGGTTGGDAAGGNGVPPLADPSAHAVLYIPEELRIPLGTEKMELRVPKGTRINLSADAAGPIQRAHLKQMSLRAFDLGIIIQSTGQGVFDPLKSMNMKGITIKPGGKFEFDYELVPEQLGTGLIALVELLAIVSGHGGGGGGGRVPDVKLKAVREKIDERLQSEAVPRLREFLAKYDHVLPGFSLKDFFGVG